MSEFEQPLTQRDFDRLTRPRRRLVAHRIATVTSIAEDLLTILDSPMQDTIQDLLDTLATLVAMTDPIRSAVWNDSRRRGYESGGHNRIPAWAAIKLEQLDQQLYELAGAVSSWCNRPHDPTTRMGFECRGCGVRFRRNDVYCSQCGAPRPDDPDTVKEKAS